MGKRGRERERKERELEKEGQSEEHRSPLGNRLEFACKQCNFCRDRYKPLVAFHSVEYRMGAAGFQLLRKQSDAGFSRFTVGRESSRVQATSTVSFDRMETKFGATGRVGVGFKIDDEGRSSHGETGRS